MSVIKIKNEQGEFVDIPAIKGEKGDTGNTGATGVDGVSITNATAGSTSQSSGNTVTPITFHKSDGSSTTVNVQAKNGINGQDGTSVSVIEATSESNAISLSQENPNNIYYWSEE